MAHKICSYLMEILRAGSIQCDTDMKDLQHHLLWTKSSRGAPCLCLWGRIFCSLNLHPPPPPPATGALPFCPWIPTPLYPYPQHCIHTDTPHNRWHLGHAIVPPIHLLLL